MNKYVTYGIVNNQGELYYEKKTLHSKIQKINEKFSTYNIQLNSGRYSEVKVEDIIDKIIETEDYSSKPNSEELVSFVKSLKK